MAYIALVEILDRAVPICRLDPREPVLLIGVSVLVCIPLSLDLPIGKSSNLNYLSCLPFGIVCDRGIIKLFGLWVCFIITEPETTEETLQYTVIRRKANIISQLIVFVIDVMHFIGPGPE